MKVRLSNLLAWCGPCLPISALGLPLVVYLPPYYAGTLGLPLATVGFIFAVVRLIDIPIDPFLGALMDNSRSRFGQFRPWMVAGAAVLMVAVYALFMAEPGVSAARTFAVLLLLYIGWSLVYLAQTAWGSRLSADYAERTRIFGWWTGANALAMLLVLLIPPLVGRLTPEAGPSAAIQAMGWFIIALLPLTVAWTVLKVPEGEAPGTSHRVSLADLRHVMADGRMQRLLLVDLLLSVLPGLAGALFLFFFVSARGLELATATALLLGYFVAGLAGAPFWMRVANRHGKHRAALYAALWMGAVPACIALLPTSSPTAAAIAFIVAGVPIGAPAFLLRAMTADLNDAQALDRQARGGGAETTGLNYALLTATQKLGYAIPVGLTYPILGLIGFDAAPGASNSPSALLGLTLLFAVPPLFLGAAAALIVRRWPITADVHADIRARLAASA
jgi:GPH family glycoside/pentoside/hexuronide:cation symporter